MASSTKQQPRSRQRLARAMGLVSLGLAVPQLLTPASVNRRIGIRPTPGSDGAMRAVGMQELLFAGGILARPAGAAGWLWGRVAGDLAHLALLGRAASVGDADRRRLSRGAAVVAGALALDLAGAVRMSRRAGEPRALHARTTLTVNRRPEEVYAFWRDFSNLPSFMWHLESVKSVDGTRSHWIARAPGGKRVEWDAEVVREIPGRLIEWRSVGRTRVPNAGLVRFGNPPGANGAHAGTEVTVELRVDPPAGRAGALVAQLFGEEPEQQVKDDLRRFKQVMETGEVARSDAMPEGTRADRQFHPFQRPGQPVA